MRFNPAKGILAESFDTPVDTARADEGLCGFEGLLFEPQRLPIVAGKVIVAGSWLGFRIFILGIVGLLVIGWLLR
jgi:hypothetical protein